MKEILKYITIVLLFIITSCTKDASVDPIFEGSVNERTAALKAEYINVLTSAENGWIGYYSPNGNTGAYTLLLKFNTDGTVNVKSDWEVGAEDNVITYRLDKTLKVELVFETYSVLHDIFSENNNDNEGEFVFNMLEVASTEITLESKTDNGYNDEEITLLKIIPATAADWDLEGVYNMVDNLASDPTKSVFRNIIVDGTAVASYSYDDTSRLATVSYVSDGQLKTVNVGVIVTPEGFDFIKPLDINGTILSSFSWNATTSLFEDTPNKAVIKYDNVPGVPLVPYDFGVIQANGRYNYLEPQKSSNAFTNFYDSYTESVFTTYGISIDRWYMRDINSDFPYLHIYTNKGNLWFDFSYEIKEDGKVYFTLTGETNAPASWMPLIQPLLDIMVGSESGYYIKGTGGLQGGSQATFSLINADNPIYETNYYGF